MFRPNVWLLYKDCSGKWPRVFKESAQLAYFESVVINVAGREREREICLEQFSVSKGCFPCYSEGILPATVDLQDQGSRLSVMMKNVCLMK